MRILALMACNAAMMSGGIVYGQSEHSIALAVMAVGAFASGVVLALAERAID